MEPFLLLPKMHNAMEKRRRITAFGASRTDLDPHLYADVTELSRKIASLGWDGLVGGHQGMMAAFCQGIRAGGGHVRGITLERFPTPPDHALSEEIRAHTFFDRMEALIEGGKAYLVLPGGLGTVAELAMTWDLLVIHVLEPRPLILYGPMWRDILDAFARGLLFSSDLPMQHVFCCESHEAVLGCLEAIPKAA